MGNAADKDQFLESMSAFYDGEELPRGRIEPDKLRQARAHMQNWSLIGAVLRNETIAKTDTSFADAVASHVAAIDAQAMDEEQQKVSLKSAIKHVLSVRRIVSMAYNTAAAAAIAAVTVLGWQIYNASSLGSFVEPAADTTMVRPVGGINLASYQNDNRETVVRLNQFDDNDSLRSSQGGRSDNMQAVQLMREKELERINIYLRGYVLGAGENR